MSHLIDNLSWKYKIPISTQEKSLKIIKIQEKFLLLIFYSHQNIYFLFLILQLKTNKSIIL